MAVLKPNGGLHEWHESLAGYHSEWEAGKVEETELVLVVGGQRDIKISYHTYPDGAPPVMRMQWHVEASLVEAKSGHVLAHRQFQNRPRPLAPVEDWNLTLIGQKVSYHTVFCWAAGVAKNGAPRFRTRRRSSRSLIDRISFSG